MVRTLIRLAWAAALCAFAAAPCAGFPLISPTEGQIVRENVKIQVPADLVPDNPRIIGFISIYIEENGTNRFMAAISRREAKLSNGVLTFFWNSKAPFLDSAGKEMHLKDGVYPMTIVVHDKTHPEANSATVHINLKNKVARTNPAPGVSLVNKLSFGQSQAYNVHSAADVYESVAGVDLPILGGLGVTSDFTIYQSVEDVRANGDLLMRYRIGEGAFTSTMGRKQQLYADMKLKPQLYSLVTKYGHVVKANMFTKQAKFTMMGVLPILPGRSVKEGDSWPDQIRVKIEGLTDLVKLEGTASLDSFEWQNGRECAKIISKLTGPLNIGLLGGKVQAIGTANAEVTTYFAYKTGKMIRREMSIDVPAAIAPGTADELNSMIASEAASTEPSLIVASGGGEGGFSPTVRPPTGFGAHQKEAGETQGKIKINVTIRLGN